MPKKKFTAFARDNGHAEKIKFCNQQSMKYGGKTKGKEIGQAP